MINVVQWYACLFPRVAARVSGRFKKFLKPLLSAGGGFLIASSLGGCTTASDAVTATADLPTSSLVASASPAPLSEVSAAAHQTTKPSSPKYRRVERKSHRATSAPTLRLASVDPGDLIGKGPGGVAKLLGVPISASQRDVSLIWTYGSTDCAFQVYFYPDIKTSLWHALQYASVDKNGGALNPSQLCIQRILTERSNGTN
jgi:hypothetical protein